MNIKSIVVGLALIVLGFWCVYRGITHWKLRVQDEFPAARYVRWGIFSLFMGLVGMFLGYIGWWASY